MIDMLPRQTREGETAYAPYPGGAVYNTAIALGRLGAGSGFLCGLSKDLFGDLLLEQMKNSGVDASLSPRLDRPCTLAFVKLVNGQATYAFYDENSALKALTEADLPDLSSNINALFFGGISLVSEPCGTAYEALMTREAGNRVTMIDPNIRQGFVTDEDATRARIERMMALADIVKLSDEDLFWLKGEGDIAKQVDQIRASGARIVLITEGAKGVTAYHNRGSLFVPSEKVDVIDTVGAGDTFNAGFLSSLSASGAMTREGVAGIDDKVLRNALTRGARAAAVTVSRAGANPPWASEI